MSRVIVVGASRGIGLEFVRQYRAEGWEVLATGRTAQALATLEGLGAEALELDVTSATAASVLTRRAQARSWDIALYVAGVNASGSATAAPSAEQFETVMRANVLGAMQLLPAIAPRLAAGGRFAFISSLLGSIAQARDSHTWVYRASKAALNMAVHSAASDYPRAVLVALSPGWVRTDMGGAHAPLSVEESVRGMRTVLAGLDPSRSGAFLNYAGDQVPW